VLKHVEVMSSDLKIVVQNAILHVILVMEQVLKNVLHAILDIFIIMDNVEMSAQEEHLEIVWLKSVLLVILPVLLVEILELIVVLDVIVS